MKFNANKNRKITKNHHEVLAASTLFRLLLVTGIVSFLNGQTWAKREDMTGIQFSSAIFCQRVSQAINDSLGDGMADGSDCVNRQLYVSTAEIGNIRNLNIVPPEGGFGNIDFDSQPMNIEGEWVDAFYNLTSLSITEMYLQNISPLSRLSSTLTHLDLSNNRIYDVKPLGDLYNHLQYLDLSNNQISEGLEELSTFTRLTTLKLVNTGLGDFDELFEPADPEYDEETGMPIGEEMSTSVLGQVLQVFDISKNGGLSQERDGNAGVCDGNLMTFEEYGEGIVLSELYASEDNLNADDVSCIAELPRLQKLDISNNHIDDFSSIKYKSYNELKADSQTFTRTTDSLDYEPLPLLFQQVEETNYFPNMPSATNTGIPKEDLTLDNAQFYEDTKVRFINAAIAVENIEDSHPATVSVPIDSGVFENSKLNVYFTGQVVTFNDSNLCDSVYAQGDTGSAFIDADGNNNWTGERIVLTNACHAAKKQIALISGGTYQFYNLFLDELAEDETPLDMTGLEEFTNLQVLSLKNNNLSDISQLQNNQLLQQLFLDYNNLESDDWPIITDFFRSLKHLHLNYNNMNEISTEIGSLENLGDLYLVHNGIYDVSPLARAPSISVLDLSENEGITEFSSMVNEESACNPSILKIADSGVTSIPNSEVIANGFSNLTSINLNGNSITNETIANLSAASRLDELYLNDNLITSTANLSEISSLKKLFLDNNQITNINGLANLTRLTELHLNNNQIKDLTNLNTLPLLATLDVKNQALTGIITNAEEPYVLPPVFAQATSLEFPRINNFRSAGNYDVENGSVNYDAMTATIEDSSEDMTITIPDGGLTGTTITLTADSGEFAGDITDNTNGEATITSTSSNSFTVTSNKACTVLFSRDDGETWTRSVANPVAEDENTREFIIESPVDTKVIIAYTGDANGDHSIDVRDVRKIISSIIGKESLSGVAAIIANANGDNSLDVRDVRTIINSILGKTPISW